MFSGSLWQKDQVVQSGNGAREGISAKMDPSATAGHLVSPNPGHVVNPKISILVELFLEGVIPGCSPEQVFVKPPTQCVVLSAP